MSFEEFQSPEPQEKSLPKEKFFKAIQSVKAQKTLSLLVLSFFAALVFTIYRSQKSHPAPETTPSISTFDVLVTMVPIRKGERASLGTLKLVPLNRRDLTPRQQLDSISHDQLQDFDGNLIAKKDISPHGILFWRDFQFSPRNKHFSKGLPTQQKVKIIYSSEEVKP